MRRSSFLIALFTCSAMSAQDAVPRLPLARPDADFYGAIGPLTVHVSAEPTTIIGERPTTYMVTIEGVLNPADVTRPDLKAKPEFAAFEAEPLPEDEVIDPAAKRRTFVWRVHPRTPDAIKIPGWAFRYYDPRRPADGPRWQQAYPTALVEPIVLERVAEPIAETPPIEVPPGYRANPGDDAPSWWRELLLVAFVLEPAVVFGAVLAWPYMFPSKHGRSRRSAAAEEAVRNLRKLRTTAGDDPAYRLGKILAHYLQERFHLPKWARTPRDVAVHLEAVHRKGDIDYHSGKRCVDLLEECDRRRFALRAGESLDDETCRRAEQLILDLERFPA